VFQRVDGGIAGVGPALEGGNDDGVVEVGIRTAGDRPLAIRRGWVTRPA